MRRSLASEDERRGLSLADADVQIRNFDGGQKFTGYASVFNTRTAIGNPLRWGFYEQVADGAFTKTLGEGDARMLIDHDSYYVVSRVSAGTLQLLPDARGLLTDSALDPNLSYVSDLRANLANRNITGMSFGFQVTKDDWEDVDVETSDGNTAQVELRTIREVKLIEVSAVTFPAYEETTAGLRHSLVPALRRRGDKEAIARAAKARPELAELLGYDEDLASKRFFVNGLPMSVDAAREAEGLPGETQGIDTPITAKGNTMAPSEERTPETPASEPADATRTDADSTPPSEPAASTRNAPSQHQLAKVRLQVLRAQLRTAA